ncbi:hypothetical protein HPB50_027228 [Hyalomma asiaticum]|uniref:Uncharacterized protein n=1 Tax=Hyalomma asiaticum TaxID=266040 RepID=A0ACB7TN17_HYAAI|nr:hypothetical protein HPB50_027228 [Hyalomma asiaticum]
MAVCRIVRNKAAEKAKHHHVSSNGGSPQPQSSPTSVITHAPASAHESSVSAAAAAAALQRPSYSINGILGIPSAEAAKRKRDDQVSQGKLRVERIQSEPLHHVRAQLRKLFKSDVLEVSDSVDI